MAIFVQQINDKKRREHFQSNQLDGLFFVTLATMDTPKKPIGKNMDFISITNVFNVWPLFGGQSPSNAASGGCPFESRGKKCGSKKPTPS